MKIGVLADVHGNLQALEAVVSSMREQGVEEYIIAGDLVADCGQPNEVIEYIRRLNATVIKGNREEYIESYLIGNQPLWGKYDQMASVAWTANVLTEENRTYLNELPHSARLDLKDKGVVQIVHGSPFKTSQLVFEDDDELLGQCVAEACCDVLVTAHTHIPFSKKVTNTLVFNPGATGVHFNKVCGAEYAILEYCKGAWVVQHYIASYDISLMKEKMIEYGAYAAAQIWCELIVRSLIDGYNHNVEFLKYCKLDVDHNGYIPNAVFKKRFMEWIKLEVE